MLSKNTKFKIYRTIILSFVLYGYETWSVTLMEKHRLRLSENSVLGRIFGPKRDKVREEWRKLGNEELNDLYSPPNIVRVTKSRIMRWAGHVVCMERGVVYAWFRWRNPKERDHLEEPGIGRRIILRWIFRKWDVGAWSGSVSLWIGTGGGHL